MVEKAGGEGGQPVKDVCGHQQLVAPDLGHASEGLHEVEQVQPHLEVWSQLDMGDESDKADPQFNGMVLNGGMEGHNLIRTDAHASRRVVSGGGGGSRGSVRG